MQRGLWRDSIVLAKLKPLLPIIFILYKELIRYEYDELCIYLNS